MATMLELLSVTNKLHDRRHLLSEWKYVLPQIVVVGVQSSGKSSVLESIIGKPVLPRGEGMVTRCPIVLKLIHTADTQTFPENEDDSSDEPSDDQSEWCVVSCEHKGRQEKSFFTNFEEAKKEIERMTNVMTGHKHLIVDDGITLEIYSPHVVDLTLVDLPGIVKVATGDQPKDIERQVTNLLHRYIENEFTVILAVCQADVDVLTSDSIKLAREVDPQCERTIVVMTKVDNVETSGLDHFYKVLRGQIVPCKLGIIGVKNRSQKDIIEEKSIQDSIEEEERFFGKVKYPIDIRAKCGTTYLREQLQRILLEHLTQCLPKLKKSIEDKVHGAKKFLGDLKELVSDEEKKLKLLELFQKFSELFKTSISVDEGCELATIFEIDFPDELNQIDITTNLETDIISRELTKFTSLHDFKFLPRKAFLSLMAKQIRLLARPALKFAALIRGKIFEIAEECAQEDKARFPNFEKEILLGVTEILTECHERAEASIEEDVARRAAIIPIRSDEISEKVTALISLQKKERDAKAANSGSGFNPQINSHNFSMTVPKPISFLQENDQCKIIKELIMASFAVTIDRFKDYCQQIIFLDLIENLIKKLHILQSKILECDHILEEPDNLCEMRKQTKHKLEEYEEALVIISNVGRSKKSTEP